MRRAVLGSCLLALLLGVSGCSSSQADGTGERERPRIRLAVSSYFTSAPLLLARAEGYFTDEGVDVEYLEPPEGGASPLIPALVTGRIDVIATSASTGLLNAIANGAPLRIVADRGYYAPGPCSYSAVVARKGLDWRTPPSAGRRRRIAATTTSHTAYIVDAAFEKLGMDADQMEFVDAPPPAVLDALGRGTLDLAHLYEPWVTHALEAGHQIVLPDHETVPNHQVSILVFGPTLLERDRDAGRRFIRAYLRGVRRYHEGKTDHNLEILSEATGYDRDLLRRICWPVISDDGRIHAETLVPFQRWARVKGYVDRVIPQEEFWDPGFVDAGAAVVRTSAP